MLSGGPTSACAAMAMTPTSSPLRAVVAARRGRVSAEVSGGRKAEVSVPRQPE